MAIVIVEQFIVAIFSHFGQAAAVDAIEAIVPAQVTLDMLRGFP